MRHERLQGNGLQLHVASCGEGPPVMLLHGFPENWQSWQHQLAPLAAAGFAAWAPDLRGYNQSDRPTQRTAYALPELAADVAALVRATGHGRAHIVGHDWGGVIAWEFAHAYPDLVNRLVIINAPHPDIYRRKIWNPRQGCRSLYALLFLVPGLAEGALAAANYFGLRQVFARGAARPGAFTPERLRAYVEAMSTPGALTAALEYYRANASLRHAPPARFVTAETLVIWGERDPALSTILLNDLAAVAPRVRVRRLPDVGHWVQNEAPDDTNRLIAEFLQA